MPSSASSTTASNTLSLHDALPICQGRRFVQEEQRGVVTRRHQRPLSAPELQHADEPPLQLPRPLDAPFGVVQDATVAHERPPFRGRSEEHTSELQSRFDLVCRLLLPAPPRPTLFPYTTLFRSARAVASSRKNNAV